MKRAIHIMSVVLLIGSAEAASAQAGRKLELGPILAVSASNFTGEDLDLAFDNDSWKSLNSTTGGAFVRFHLDKYFSAVPQLIYSKRGCKFFYNEIVDDTVSTHIATVRLDYIDVSLLTRFRPQLHANLNPYIIAGPAISIAVSSELEWQLAQTGATGGTILEPQTLSRVDIINGVDVQLGVVVGIGLDFQMSRYGFSVESRYYSGLRNTFTDVTAGDVIADGELVNSEGEALRLKNATLSLVFSLSYALEI